MQPFDYVQPKIERERGLERLFFFRNHKILWRSMCFEVTTIGPITKKQRTFWSIFIFEINLGWFYSVVLLLLVPSGTRVRGSVFLKNSVGVRGSSINLEWHTTTTDRLAQQHSLYCWVVERNGRTTTTKREERECMVASQTAARGIVFRIVIIAVLLLHFYSFCGWVSRVSGLVLVWLIPV
jgi:hypothetical protein